MCKINWQFGRLALSGQNTAWAAARRAAVSGAPVLPAMTTCRKCPAETHTFYSISTPKRWSAWNKHILYPLLLVRKAASTGY